MNKLEFLSRIVEKQQKEDLILQLKKEDKPLVMWGIGSVGEMVYEYLHKNGVKIDAVWVDGELSCVDFHECMVLNREEVQAKYQQFNVIIGHSWYELGKHIKKEMQQVNKVFYLCRGFYNLYERVPYENVRDLAERYAALCEKLADEKSIDCLIAYLNTMITGDMEYVFEVYERAGNFFSNMIYKVTSHEVLLDIGAYDGDTIRTFLTETSGNYKKIIAVEPDAEAFLKLSDYVAKASLKNVIISKCGAWDKKEVLEFKEKNDQCSSVDRIQNRSADRIITIYANRLDSLFENEDVSLIKINYWNGIVEAIKGCEKIIRKNQPKIAMDIGFDIIKVLEASEYIDSLKEGYKLYLRFNRAMPSTLTLYAIVEG